jgi:hypothetical protein
MPPPELLLFYHRNSGMRRMCIFDQSGSIATWRDVTQSVHSSMLTAAMFSW